MPPEEAVTMRVPSAPVVPVGVTSPADTVAMLVLLDVHWATLVMSTVPLQVLAFAVSCTLVLTGFVIFPVVGVTEIV